MKTLIKFHNFGAKKKSIITSKPYNSNLVCLVFILLTILISGCQTNEPKDPAILYQTGVELYSQERYAHAIPVLKDAFYLFKEQRDTMQMVPSLNDLIFCMIQEETTDSAKKYFEYLEAIQPAEQEFQYIRYLQNKASLEAKRVSERIPYYHKALKILGQHHPDKYGIIAEVHKNIASDWMVCCRNVDSAQVHLDKAREANTLAGRPSAVLNRGIGYIQSRIHYYKREYREQERILNQNYLAAGSLDSTANILKGRCLIDLAIFYRSARGQYSKSTRFLERAIPLFKNRKKELARTYALLGTNRRHLGDHQEALKFYQLYESMLYELEADLGRKIEVDIARNVTNKGNVLYDAHVFDSAVVLYDSSIALKQNATADLSGTKSMAFSYLNSALARIRLGKLEQADSLLEMGLKIIGRKPSVLSSSVRMDKAELNIIAGNLEMGSQILDSAGAFFLSINGYPEKKAEWYILKGRLETKLQQHKKALEAFHAAVAVLAFNADKDKPYEISDLEDHILPPILLEALLWKARSLDSLGRTELALGTAMQCIDLIGEMRFSFKTEGSKIFLAEQAVPAFELALNLSHSLFQRTHDPIYLDRSFEVMERSKSMVVLEYLSSAKAKRVAGVPDSLVEKQLDLREEIAFLRVQIQELRHSTEEEPEEIQRLSERLFAAEKAISVLEQAIKDQFPSYDPIQELATVDIQGVQSSMLENEQCLVEFFMGDRSIFVMRIEKTQATIRQFPIPENFESSVLDLRNKITQPPSRKGMEEYGLLASFLHDRIFIPSVEGISKKDILIVPDGLISLIPMEALVKDYSSGQNYLQMSFLIQEYNISYLASASILAMQQSNETRPNPSSSYVGFAPSFSGKYHELTNLQSTVEAIGESTNGQVVKGKAATQSAFRELAPQAGILHLATHAFADHENPMNARFIFSEGKETPSDSALFAYELYYQRLDKVSLTILSACNTAYGQVARGEGIINLARGFNYAGCPSTVMSLWEVADGDASRQITIGFIENLRSGLPKNRALRKAKLAYLKACKDNKSARPFLWAVQVLSGDIRPLRNGS